MPDGTDVRPPAITALAGAIGSAAVAPAPAGPARPSGIGHDGLAAALAGFEQRRAAGVQALTVATDLPG